MKLLQVRSALVSVALVSVAVLAVPAAPAGGAVSAEACPPARVPATAFTDTVSSLHRSAIDCAAWWQLATGRTSTEFGPGDDITRGQTAAMAARLLRHSGVAPPEVPSAGFGDTAGHTFERDIDLLVHLDVLDGVSDTSFEPDRPIQRAQMATLVSELFAAAYGSPLDDGTATFDDVADANPHRAAIQRLAASGITTGITASTFGPTLPVSRAAMASFLTRSASLLVERSLAPLPTAVPATDDAYARTWRGAWVNLFEDTLKSRAGITAMLDELAAAGANVVIAQVIRRQDAYYESEVLPRTTDPDLPPGFDVLAELIPAAHARGIEVHAWYSVAPTYHSVYDDLPAPEGWIHTEHGRAAPEADRWVTQRNDGRWSDYLDPGLPEVQDHVAAVVGEIAANYDVDGIHLDYTRYESEYHGYNRAALRSYYDETGTSTWPQVTDPAWSDWRREQTRRIVVKARAAIAASGRDVDLSAAVITWASGPPTLDRAGFQRTLSYRRVLQDWDRWVREGIVDAVMPMNYFREDRPEQAAWFDQWLAYEARLTAEVAPRIVPGPGGWLNRPSDTLVQVADAMRRTNGAVVYSWHRPTVDGSRVVWSDLAAIRWGYPPAHP